MRKPPITITAIVLACGLLAACGSSGGTAAGTPSPKRSSQVTVFMYSEYIDPAIVESFQKETGITIVLDTYENTEEMMSKVRSAGDQYDVVVVSDHAIPLMAAKGAFKALDRTKVPNAKNVSARFVKPAYDPEGTYSLPYQWGTMGLVWRTDKLPGFTPSWAAVLDPSRQAGPVVLIDSMRDLMAAALLQKGFSPNTRSADELKAAGDLLHAARTKRMVGFYGSPDSVAKVIAGDAWVGIAYNGDAVAKLDDRTDFGVPAEGTIIWVDAMTVPAKAPHPDNAYAFMDYILRPEIGARLSNFLEYATPNEASLASIDETVRNDRRVYPSDAETAKMVMLQDAGDAATLYDQVWTRVKAGE
jgi:spermidine/putrescine transport system substrate-binding protein